VGRIPTMAYVVPRPRQRWELRESHNTAAGPRSRTLASFRTLTAGVVARARERAGGELSEAMILQAAQRAGAPIARSAPDAAAASLLAEVARGCHPTAALRRLLVDALAGPGEPPTDAERAVAPWIAATPEERGAALKDLLLLADQIPTPPRSAALRFPHLNSAST
jgi:hypothetical protein